MSEPIIIETPAPPTRERLVLVPPGTCTDYVDKPGLVRLVTTDARDATPADLARAGYEPVERAEKAEWSARVARMALANEHQDREGVRIRKDLGTQDAPCPCDTDPEQGMGMHSPPCPLHEAARALRRKTSWEDAAHTMDGELKAAITRAEKAERERDEVRRLHSEAEAQVACRSELRAQLAAAEGRFRATEAERDTLRAELARLTAPAPGEGEPTGAELRAIVDREGLRIGVDAALVDIWRAGVAHERARQQLAKDRATDEELAKVGREAWNRNIGDDDSITAALRATTLAVAARVRKERCLVAQAVGTNVDIRVCEDDGGGFMVGVHAPGCDEELTRYVPPADVPTTLARLLGEVSRG